MRTLSHASATHPWRVIALWTLVALALSVFGGLKAPSVTTDDPAAFLPEASESARALELARDAFGVPEGTAAVAVAFDRADGRPLTAADRGAVAALAAGMPAFRPDPERLRADAGDGLGVDEANAGRIVAAAPGPVADRGRFALVGVQWQADTLDPVAQAAFRQFRDGLRERAADRGLRAALTGGIASATDDADATETRQAVSSGLLVAAIVLLSALFLRGVLAAVLPLLVVTLVAGAASGLVVTGALVLDVQLDAGTPQLISVVLIGIGVDYFLFLLFRVRERLRAGDDGRTAAAHAAARVGPVVAAAAVVVAAAFATLTLAEFGQFRVLGPSVALSVLVMLAAALTFMPAIAAVSGRRLFWPSRAWEREDDGGRIARLADAVARRPARAALAVTAVLALLGTAALGTRSDHDLGGGGPATEATRTEDRIAAALPRGATDPQDVHVRSDRPLSAAALAPLRARLARVDGVGAVAAPQLSADRRVARLDVALDAPSATARAMDVARGPLRDAARAGAPAQSTALVGGSAAVLADVSDAVARDLRLVFPVAAALILLVLVATLRSVVAPLVLLAAVALEFAAALGASVLAVQFIGGAPGVAFTLPLVLFLFVVAIGTDYNLLVAARLREEARAGATPREAARAAVRRVGPAVTAAGLVLAASFGTLVLAADSATRQTGFALATGILIASLAVSVVLVPALAALLGPRLWWPVRSRRPRPRPARNAPVTPAPVRR